MQNQEKIQKINRAIIFSLFMTGAIVNGAGAAFAMPKDLNIVFILVFVLFVYYISYIVHIIVHEAGHMVFGLLSGYRFNSFRIYNLMLQLDDDGKLRFYSHNITGTAGQCLMVPPECDPAKVPYFWYNIGGIAANIILSAVFAPLCLLTNAGGCLITVFFSITMMGLFTALVNGIPLPGFLNDGSNIIDMHRHEKARISFYVQLQSQILLKKGVRLRDFPEEWFIMPDIDELQDTQVSILAVYCCERIFDERKFREAHQEIDLLLRRNAALFAVHEQELKANALFCELIGNADPLRISDYYDKAMQKMIRSMPSYPKFIRTEYTYQLLYKNNEQKAEKLLQKFESAAKKYPFQIEIETERELLEIAKKTALERKAG